MITQNKIPGIPVSAVAEVELKGLSTDSKPIEFMGKKIGVNSLFIELDTGDLYYFNGNTWEVIGMNGESGSAGLPAVTSEDNGKVLGVVNGQWNKMENGGGSISVDGEITEGGTNPVTGGAIYDALEELRAAIAAGNDYRVDIEPVIDEQTQQPVIKANKSIADIYAAAVALKHVWAKITVPGIVPSYQRMEITQYINAANTYEVQFGCVREDDGAAQPIVVFGINTSAGDPAGDSWNYAE